MMKRVAAAALVALAAAAALIWFGFRGRCDLTVSALFRIKDPAVYAHGYVEQNVLPADEAELARGNWDAAPARVRFRAGVLHTAFDHGPAAVSGLIPRQSLEAAWPGTPYHGDWPFTVSIYNTSSGRRFHMYLDIRYDAETDAASADLYIFQDGSAHAVADHWSGKLGEPITAGAEI